MAYLLFCTKHTPFNTRLSATRYVLRLGRRCAVSDSCFETAFSSITGIYSGIERPQWTVSPLRYSVVSRFIGDSVESRSACEYSMPSFEEFARDRLRGVRWVALLAIWMFAAKG